jgi:DNA end-binding protein Ku
MAARAMWKARLVLGSADGDGDEVPVKLYAGVEDRQVHFNLLAPDDHVRVEQRMVHPDTGEEVPREERQKGLEVERGVYVVLDADELDSLTPEPSREIRLTRFVPPEAIDHRWYDRPYFLGPDGDPESYFALVAALEAEDREGVAHWVMRGKAHVGALRSDGRALRLVTLRHAGEVIDAAELPTPEGRDFSERETEMAENLVDALAAPFDPDEYRDDYRQAVRGLVEAKVRGDEAPTAAAPAAPSTSDDDDLEKLLAASLGKGGKRGKGDKRGKTKKTAARRA